MCVPWFSYMAFDFPGVSNCAQLGKPGAHSPPLLAQNRVSLRGMVKLAKFLLPSLMLPNLYSVTHWFFCSSGILGTAPLKPGLLQRPSPPWVSGQVRLLHVLPDHGSEGLGPFTDSAAHMEICLPVTWHTGGRTPPGSPGSYESHRGTLLMNRCWLSVF